jgi:hypothetical protein
MARRKQIVATVKLARKPGWRYWPCVDERREVVIMGREGDDWRRPARVVARPRFRHVDGSSYELEGTRLVRGFDPDRENKQAAAAAARDAKLARLRAPAFAKAVAAYGKRLGAKPKLLDTVEYDDLVTAIWQLRLRKPLPLEWLAQANSAPPGGVAFALEFESEDEPVDGRMAYVIRALGVVPRDDAYDVARLIPTQGAVTPEDLVRTITRVCRDGDGRIAIASPEEAVLALELSSPRKALQNARALHRLDTCESTVAEMRKELRRGSLFLWWD